MASECNSQSQLSAEKTKGRIRGTNFQKIEVLKLEELVSQHFDIINSRLTNSVTNRMKKETWDTIAVEVSSLGISRRTKEECQTKWGNLKRAAKEAMTGERIERRKTGGGVCEITATDQESRVLDLYKDTSAFSGIAGGLDSDETDGIHYISSLMSDEKGAKCETPAITKVIPQASNKESCSRGKSVLGRRGQKRTRQDMLMDYQIQYFKGEVDKQGLEKELLEVKLRLLKTAEAKLDEMAASDLLRFISEQ